MSMIKKPEPSTFFHMNDLVLGIEGHFEGQCGYVTDLATDIVLVEPADVSQDCRWIPKKHLFVLSEASLLEDFSQAQEIGYDVDYNPYADPGTSGYSGMFGSSWAGSSGEYTIPAKDPLLFDFGSPQSPMESLRGLILGPKD